MLILFNRFLNNALVKNIMSIHRTKRKIRENKVPLIFGILIMFILIFSAYIISKQPKKEDIKEIKIEETDQKIAKYEITKTDIFSLPNFKSDEISVMNAMLGDSFESVLDKLGYPDSQREDGNLLNIEYSKRINLNETGLILHFKDKILNKIAIREPFNVYLIGKTKISHSKDEIYAIFGAPDDLKFVPISEGSFIVFRNNIYKEKGLEIYIRKNKQIGFGLVS